MGLAQKASHLTWCSSSLYVQTLITTELTSSTFVALIGATLVTSLVPIWMMRAENKIGSAVRPHLGGNRMFSPDPWINGLLWLTTINANPCFDTFDTGWAKPVRHWLQQRLGLQVQCFGSEFGTKLCCWHLWKCHPGCQCHLLQWWPIFGFRSWGIFFRLSPKSCPFSILAWSSLHLWLQNKLQFGCGKIGNLFEFFPWIVWSECFGNWLATKLFNRAFSPSLGDIGWDSTFMQQISQCLCHVGWSRPSKRKFSWDNWGLSQLWGMQVLFKNASPRNGGGGFHWGNPLHWQAKIWVEDSFSQPKPQPGIHNHGWRLLGLDPEQARWYIQSPVADGDLSPWHTSRCGMNQQRSRLRCDSNREPMVGNKQRGNGLPLVVVVWENCGKPIMQQMVQFIIFKEMGHDSDWLHPDDTCTVVLIMRR